ncbi:S8 family serine peptidase [Micrococcus luteus]|nr:S8 family serine peptidase [Micrococcus luteus]
MTHSHSRRRQALGITSALALVLAGAASASATTDPAGSAADDAIAAAPAPTPDPAQPRTAPETFEDGGYIVLLAEQPVASYDGGTPGFAPTKPGKGKGRDNGFQPKSANAKAYSAHLKKNQDATLRRAGAGPDTPHTRYTTALNGFAGTFTAEEAAALAADPAVLAVVPDEIRPLDTVSSPDVLGLTGKKGLWAQVVGKKTPAQDAGRGVVVGIVDSGIRPEAPSFQDQGHPAAPADWAGGCETGDEDAFSTDSCNDKLIGAKYFVNGFGTGRLAPVETLSPLDAGGHGTHTASTAAGNSGVSAVIDGVERGTISGMAPGAHVAAYKACWEGVPSGGCATSDTVAAINAAVADGVDVLNYSISGTTTNVVDPVEVAFMHAASAGVFVAASSGNSGPTVSTTAHPSPWITTVAASTHAVYEQTLVTGDGQRFIGSSITAPLEAETPIVYAGDVAAAGATSASAALCLPGTLDPAATAGKLVVCDRGENARAEKSQVVADAGGVGMALVNVTDSGLNADLHAIPAVHLSHTERDRLLAYVKTDRPTGRILATNEGTATRVPEVAGFSSRGPSLAAKSGLLKPDVSAPGVDVLAAYSPDNGGERVAYSSGTSMSSPHIAGLGALLKQARPDLSPMGVKSALMTTARDHASATSPFAGGAGFVDPLKALDPGLVFDSDQQDWYDYLAGQGIAWSNTGEPVSEHPIPAAELNVPSLAISELYGSQTVTRTLKNVGGNNGTWTARVKGLQGLDVTVSPNVIRPTRGSEQDVAITVTAAGAPAGQWATGHVVWSGPAGKQVRIPVAVRPGIADAPAAITVARDADTLELPVLSGIDGTLSTRVNGLVRGDQYTGTTVRRAVFDASDAALTAHDFAYPRGYPKVRIEAEAADPDVDLDIYVTSSWSSYPVARSITRGTGMEVLEQSIISSAPQHRIHVVAKPGTDLQDSDAPIDYTLRVFFPKDGDAGNLVFDPASADVKPGAEHVFQGTLTTDGTSVYLGTVDILHGGTVVDSTKIRVE